MKKSQDTIVYLLSTANEGVKFSSLPGPPAGMVINDNVRTPGARLAGC